MRQAAAGLTAAVLLAGAVAPSALAVANGAPVPGRDLIAGAEDGGVLAGNVLANDTDPDGDTLAVASTHAPGATVGTLTIGADGAYEFTPAENWFGTALAWYFVTDGHGKSRIAYVDISISAVNDDPVVAGHTVAGTEDTPKTVTAAQLLASATDVDGDTLAVSGVSGAEGGTAGWAAGTATFTPDADACGVGAGGFDYTAGDGHGGSATGHVTVDLACTNDAPVAAVDEYTDGTEDTAWTIDAAMLAANDDDVDGDTLSVASVGTPSHGTVDLTAGTVTFTPDADFDGTGTFEYIVGDGTTTDTGAVSVDFAGTNDAPVAVDDGGTIAAYDPGADFDVAANDEDIDGDSLAATDASVDAAAGTATIAGGEVHFVPAAGFTGSAVVTYTVSDGDLTDTGTLTIDVTPDAVAPAVDVPTVTFGTGRVNESAPLLVSWAGVDAGSGIATWEVEVRVGGAAYAPVYGGTATHVTQLYPFGTSLVWRVRATDHAGNTSDWAVSATRSLAAYQGGAPATWTGSWTKVSTTSASGTSYRYATTKGNKVSLVFTGREVLFVATKSTKAGSVRVYLDGVRQGTYSETATKTLYGRIIASRAWGSTGSHRVTIIAAQDTKRTTFDAFVVLK